MKEKIEMRGSSPVCLVKETDMNRISGNKNRYPVCFGRPGCNLIRSKRFEVWVEEGGIDINRLYCPLW